MLTASGRAAIGELFFSSWFLLNKHVFLPLFWGETHPCSPPWPRFIPLLTGLILESTSPFATFRL